LPNLSSTSDESESEAESGLREKTGGERVDDVESDSESSSSIIESDLTDSLDEDDKSSSSDEREIFDDDFAGCCFVPFFPVTLVSLGFL
jgi:hypothetical protein